MSTWRGADIANAFGIADEGLVLNGAFCLKTPLGLATPTLYRGDLDFLQWLGAELPHLNTKLGRLGLSRLLQAPSGNYYAAVSDEYVLLSTLETGPSCDPHNAFELFTVAAGVAHVHRQKIAITAEQTPNWLLYYQAQRDKLAQLSPPNLPKRTLAAWSHLEEVWRLCVEEAMNLLGNVDQSSREVCLTLGLQSFSDFVYLADRHQVHYNLVANCQLDSPAVDIARLLAAAGGETRVANNLLLSYQRVRQLTPSESKEVLAHLWFPYEVDLALLQDQAANPLSLQRACTLLRDKIGMISELEDILLTPCEEIESQDEELQDEKEVLVVSGVKAGRPGVVEPEKLSVPEAEPQITEEEIAEPTVEVEAELAVEEQQPAMAVEVPHINMAAAVSKRAAVWGPFPRPLGAPPVPPQPDAEIGRAHV